jgi:hypothetical protein
MPRRIGAWQAEKPALRGFAEGGTEVVAGAEFAIEESADHCKTGVRAGFAVLGFGVVTTGTIWVGRFWGAHGDGPIC